jgi:hypothetical protein
MLIQKSIDKKLSIAQHEPEVLAAPVQDYKK